MDDMTWMTQEALHGGCNISAGASAQALNPLMTGWLALLN
jgi:hypothetical protein